MPKVSREQAIDSAAEVLAYWLTQGQTTDIAA